MSFGIDCAHNAAPSAYCLKQNGVTFVCRYIASPHPSMNWKRLSLDELIHLRGAGLAVVLVYETSAGRALGGFNAGVEDGAHAKLELDRLKLPPSTPVYFAVDKDIVSAAQLELVAGYFQGVRLRFNFTQGAYGEYDVVKYLFERKLISRAWQTYAWSGTKLHRQASLYQYSNGHTLCRAGKWCDYDKSFGRDYGQIPRPAPQPIPVAPPLVPGKLKAWWARYVPTNKADRARFFAYQRELERRSRK